MIQNSGKNTEYGLVFIIDCPVHEYGGNRVEKIHSLNLKVKKLNVTHKVTHNTLSRWPKGVRVGKGPGILDIRHYKGGRSSTSRTGRL